MSRAVSYNDTKSADISGYDQTDYAYYSVSNISRAYTGSTSTTYGSVNLTRGKNAVTYIYFLFDTSSIPANATITSVSCSAKLSISNVSVGNVAANEVDLCSGTTTKDSTILTGTTTVTITLSGGTWTRAEVNDVRLKLYAMRGTGNTNYGYNFRIYGGTLTVGYTVNETYYEVTTSCNSSSVTISPSSAEYSAGSNVDITISGDITGGVATDNNVDVTSSITGSGTSYTYTISNISADHVFVLTMPDTGPTVSIKQNGTWVQASKVYIKQSGSWVQATKIYVKNNGSWES